MMPSCLSDGCDRLSYVRGYCTAHYQRLLKNGGLPRTQFRGEPTETRFLRHVVKTDGCWEWQSTLINGGYGQFHPTTNKSVVAHRFSYELVNGPVPEGLDLDHLCRNRRCVRPDHLEAVTHRENSLRGIGLTVVNAAKTHCLNGHEFVEGSYYSYRGTDRKCKQCIADRDQKRRLAMRVTA